MDLLRKAAVLTATVCVVIPLISGCSQNPSPGSKEGQQSSSVQSGKKLVIGFSQIGSESDWRRAHTNSVQEEAAKQGVELKFADAQQKQENQLKAIKSFVAQHVDAIILSPVTESGWEPILKEAKAAHIPVILSDRGIRVSDPELYATLVAGDFVKEGQKAADWLAKKTDGKCNIVEIEGTAGAAPALDRKKGFDDEIKKYPGMKVIKSQTGDFKRIGGKQVMEAIIKAEGKNIQAVYAHNDDMALGAVQALEAAGMKPGKDVVVVSCDAVKAAFDAIIAGKMNATVECTPLLGPSLIDACKMAANGEKLDKKIVPDEGIFDSSNAAKMISGRKY